MFHFTPHNSLDKMSKAAPNPAIADDILKAVPRMKPQLPVYWLR